MEDGQFVIDSVVCGHHIYKDGWTPGLSETLQCVREELKVT